MKLKKSSKYTKGLEYNTFCKILGTIKILMFSFLSFYLVSCESFLEIDPPINKLVSETVFEDSATVESALANIYYKMQAQGMVSGSSGLSILMGTYSDELDYIGTNEDYLKIYNHNITASNETISSWWSHAYNLIYAANDIIKGVENSSALNVDDQQKFKGEALFVRGYLHSLLVGLYGDVPYITTTNYIENNTVARMPVNLVYENIIADLTLSLSLLDDASGERIYPNKSAANALLSRIYLYTENWTLAETIATNVIDSHVLEADLSKVFLKDSPETLWQFKPGDSPRNTQEGQQLVIKVAPTTEGYTLTDNLLATFELGDLRQSNWVGSVTSTDGLTTLYFAHKYKETLISTTQASLEYSIIFRLAEQYLIRAEARAHMGDIDGAQEDLNIIRNRAGLGNTTATTLNNLLDAILQERQVELFTEHGQRWFDLKRMKKAIEALTPLKANWLNTHILFPIPDTELLANPYLKPQNLGY
ncbi:RagB/SusD family nutrient uptake outer membrane protein [Flavivirga rizhaonensis]|uniref:RagB/SusD family nutrient uptake outer membrane protein n=1 Tax=Flavivirga rizhaonensis TaxID=2559571 RepID=A0A4S1E144_9FLAO|nr:RagB/SusD family nutrient uptake outer membrane protein [Flavivirga rizhaonensis]TGV03612.1 RagB/SusD family nutrient uptake outer membrane protein [Flavivirga rizhaonensis]